MSERPSDPTSLDSLFGTEVDWRLGQSDRTTAAFLWGFVLVLFLTSLAPAGFLVVRCVLVLGGASRLSPHVIAGLGAAAAVVMLLPGGVMRYFGRSRDGLYGRVTRRLMDAMPHHEVHVKGPITLLPGLRPRLKRPGVLFLVPLRLVIVSRGWRTWMVLWCLALLPIMLVTGGTEVLLVNTFYAVPLIGFFGARRIVYQELFYNEIGDVVVDGATCTIRVEGGPLHPSLECSANDPERIQALADAVRAALDGRPEIADPGAGDAARAEDLRQLEIRNAEE